jgi:hypothetical protein
MTETTILTLATRPAASLAAGILLSCIPAPAGAGQPVSKHPTLSVKQQPECRRLRAAILEAEQSERRVRAAMMESVQLDLLSLRKRYRKLGCRTAARA